MVLSLSKRFPFSSSFSRDGKVYGYNYVLHLVTDAMTPEEEKNFESRILDGLIGHVHSRDLSSNVDFLKGLTITDENLLKAFWGVIQREIKPHRLRSLTLERDSRTSLTLSEAV